VSEQTKSDKNPDGVPKEVVDGLRDGTANRRSQFYKDITIPFYGFNRPGAVVSEGIRENWWRQGMMGGIKRLRSNGLTGSNPPWTRDEYRPPENLLIKWRSHAGCGFNLSTMCRRVRKGPSR
jgi:hypothetical protein